MGTAVKAHSQHRQKPHHRQSGQHPHLSAPDTGTHTLHDLPTRRFGQFLRRQPLSAQKLTDGKPQRLRQRFQHVDARHAPARLPLADSLVRHVEP